MLTSQCFNVSYNMFCSFSKMRSIIIRRHLIPIQSIANIANYNHHSHHSEPMFSFAPAAILSAFFLLEYGRKTTSCDDPNSSIEDQSSANTSPDSKTNFPIYRRAEVATHKTKATRVWVTFRDGRPIIRRIHISCIM